MNSQSDNLLRSDVPDLRHLILGMRAAYARGENAMEYARQAASIVGNSTVATLIAYDLQAGTYVAGVRANPVVNSKSDLVLDLCQYFGAQYYLSGTLGHDYLIEDDFTKAGIAIEYQRFQSPTYHQLWGAFIPNLGILDWWMNTSEPIFSSR